MQSHAKELFNQLLKEEEEELKYTHSYRETPNYRLGGRMKYPRKEIPDLSNLEHCIECEVSPDICPMLWEELDVDYEDVGRRYCTHCETYVYRAENAYMVKKLEDENRCMAISNSTLDIVQDLLEKEREEKLRNRLKLSKLFLLYKHDIEALTYSEKLKRVCLDILDSDRKHELSFTKKRLRWLTRNGVDTSFIFNEIISKIEDKEFLDHLSTQINSAMNLQKTF